MRGDKLMKTAAEALSTPNSVYIGEERSTNRKKHKNIKDKELICLSKKQIKALYRKTVYRIFAESAAGNLKILVGMLSYVKPNYILFENNC